MASGRPDWHSIVTITGKHGDFYKPVLVDSTGQLYIVMTGQELITENPQTIAVDGSGIILARLQGIDGGTLHDVKVDGEGNILARMTVFDGSDPVDIKVDTDGYLIARIQGHDGSTLQDVKVDGEGYMLAVMKGNKPTGLDTIALDSDGLMKATIAYQEVEEDYIQYSQGADSSHTYKTITGKGVLLGGWFWAQDIGPLALSKLTVSIDTKAIETLLLTQLYDMGQVNGKGFPYTIVQYDIAEGCYGFVFCAGIGFDNELKFSFQNASAGAFTGYCSLVWAIMP